MSGRKLSKGKQCEAVFHESSVKVPTDTSYNISSISYTKPEIRISEPLPNNRNTSESTNKYYTVSNA
jgi:hypothetical protein